MEFSDVTAGYMQGEDKFGTSIVLLLHAYFENADYETAAWIPEHLKILSQIAGQGTNASVVYHSAPNFQQQQLIKCLQHYKLHVYLL